MAVIIRLIAIIILLLLLFHFVFRECWQILNNRSFAGDRHRVHFECGVRLGVGAFNLVEYFIRIIAWWRQLILVVFLIQLISMLPQRIMKLLEFIGFAGSKV